MSRTANAPLQHVGEILTSWSERPDFRDRPGLITEDRTWTFGQLEAETNRLARVLRSSGVQRGQVVAVLLPNCSEFVLLLFAILKIGAILCPINVSFKTPEIIYLLENAGAVQLVAHSQFEPKLLKLQERLPYLRKIWYADAATDRLDSLYHFAPDHTALPPEWEVAPEDVALMIYTSGTAGYPRGVELTHHNVLANAGQISAALQLADWDRALLIMPLYHVNGILVTALAPLLVGGSVVLRPDFRADRFWEEANRYQPTYFSAVPTMYNFLLQAPPAAGDLSSLRFALCGAAPMPVALLRAFEERFAIRVIEGYGLSEGTCLSSVSSLQGPRQAGSVGLPLPGQEVRIVDEQDQELPRGQVGEIVIRGQNVMRGYHGNTAATAETLKAGWLHTGDLGYRDADSYLFVADRKKDMIIRAGTNIYPKEVEQTLYRHPKVREAAVIGVPDAVYGERVKAFVVLNPGEPATQREIIDFCVEHLAPYKVPELVVFLDGLPKNAAGKVVKAELRQRGGQETGQPA